MTTGLSLFVEAIKACEAASTQAAKLEAISGLDWVGQRLAVEALSPFRVFHIKKIKDIPPNRYAAFDADPVMFFDLLDALNTRTITGHDALNRVGDVLTMYTADTAAILKRVLVKKLKCGASDTTFNKVYPDLVPIYSCMGADSYSEKYEWEFPLQMDAKYDGNRVTFFVYPDGTITNKSRNGLPVDWVDGLFDAELRTFVQNLDMFTSHEQSLKMNTTGVVVDVEVVSDKFSETAKARGSKNTDAKKKQILRVFDVMSVNDWDRQQGTMTQRQRHDLLVEVFDVMKHEQRIKMAECRIVHSYEEALEYYNYLLGMGLEGAILKRLGSYYLWNERNRTADWTKWKPFFDCSGIIYDVYTGNTNSEFEFSLGGFRVVGQAHTGEMFVTDCGGGLSKELRAQVSENPEPYIGQVIDLKYQEVSIAEDSEYHALRFNNMTKFRPDLGTSYFTDPRVEEFYLKHGGKGVDAFKETVRLGTTNHKQDESSAWGTM